MAEVRRQIEEYRRRRTLYQRFTRRLTALIRELIERNQIRATVESRTKTVDSFSEKLRRKGYKEPFSEMTDLSGIRIVARTLSDLEEIRDLIPQEFTVDVANSVDKREDLDADQFGYLSLHYVVGLSAARSSLPEWEDFAGLVAEIQVRTILQHAWAAVQHPADYKNPSDIPGELRRRLFRLSALFELADDELDRISSDAQNIYSLYRREIEGGNRDIEINADSLRAYVEHAEKVADWVEYISSLGVDVGAAGNISRDVEMAEMAGLKTLADLEMLLSRMDGWGEEYLREFYQNTWGELPDEAGGSDRNAILTLSLIGNYPDIFTNEILESDLGFGSPERATEPARRLREL